MMPSMDLTSGLNDAQKRAVTHRDGPLMIVAGAGTGKTKTLTHRIAALIADGIPPSRILAVTFTNKAAKEMRERVAHLLSVSEWTPYASDVPFIGTFHSLSVKMLRESGKAIGIRPSFAIYDRDDSTRAMREAIKEAGGDPKEFPPSMVLGYLSKYKNAGVTLEELTSTHSPFETLAHTAGHLYAKRLREANALDFDDLLVHAHKLLEIPDVRTKYQERWSHVHVDEYQDTNRVQEALIQNLVSAHKNICVVGDADQCLPAGTKIATPDGNKKIENLRKNDLVMSIGGHGSVCAQKITKIHSHKNKGGLVVIKTKRGSRLTLTPNHILFARLSLSSGPLFYTYLMYRKDRGFRIGIVQGTRKVDRENAELGLLVRSNQEGADRIWVLRVSKTRADAQYYEQVFAFTYGIPTTVFHTIGRKMDMRDRHIKKLYAEIPTKEKVLRLFRDLDMSFDYPHYRAQGTTRSNDKRARINLTVTLCDGKYRGISKPWGITRLSINTADRKLKKALSQSGFNVRKGKRKDWRMEITRLDYGEIEKIIRKIETMSPNIYVVRKASITKNKRFLFQPAANILPTMNVGYYKNGTLIEDMVVSVGREKYGGLVYDLDIENTHNYIAENVPVHNSIYGWRSADVRIMLDFKKTYPNADVVTLEENYRSTDTILNAANAVIDKNIHRTKKKLFTSRAGGASISVYGALTETDEARHIAEHVAEKIRAGVPAGEIAILFRTNAQSRVFEEAMLAHDVPYHVVGTRFFDREEVKHVFAYLSAARNPENVASLARIANVPARGIGKVSLMKIISGEKDTLTGKARESVHALEALLAKIRHASGMLAPSELVRFVITESGLENMYRSRDTDDVERVENMHEVATVAARYDTYPKESRVQAFMDDVALLSDQDTVGDHTNAVRLMTVHAAKGLEFDVVFVAGMEEGLFPHERSGDARTAVEREEERRLFYVAITRARKELFLSYANIRTTYGMQSATVPSSFLGDIPEHLIDAEGESVSWGEGLLTID